MGMQYVYTPTIMYTHNVCDGLPTFDNMIEKIIDFISVQTSRNWFLFFCFILPFIGLIFSQTMAIIGFISSSFLQLALLPILSRWQAVHDSKLDAILELLQKEEEQELQELSVIIDKFNTK